MKRIIEKIFKYKEYLKTQSDYQILIIAYGWIFLACLSVGSVLIFFKAHKAATIIIRYGLYFLGGMFLNMAILLIIELFTGRKTELDRKSESSN